MSGDCEDRDMGILFFNNKQSKEVKNLRSRKN